MNKSQPNQLRLASLDVMRGLIMILLAAESCRVYLSLNNFSIWHGRKSHRSTIFSSHLEWFALLGFSAACFHVYRRLCHVHFFLL